MRGCGDGPACTDRARRSRAGCEHVSTARWRASSGEAASNFAGQRSSLRSSMLLAVLLALAVVLVFLGWRRQPGPFAVEWTASGARYKCGRCRKWHDGFPNWHFDAPDPVLALDPDVRATRAMREEDGYVLDKWFFGLALLELSVQDTPDSFAWGVWV